MEVTIKLREDFVGEPQYEWQVTRLDTYGLDWIMFRSESRWEAVDWLSSEGEHEYAYTLKRVALPQRGELTPYAMDLLKLIVDRYGQKINVVRMVRAITGLGLREAVDLVEDYLAMEN